MTEEFAAALLDPAAARPAGLRGPGGAPAGRRFDVYRNNVAVSLREALGAGFPVLRKLLGAEFFDAMAGIFLRAHPPRSPVLAAWGDELPAFLATFPPVAHLPYLPDVARLELALRASYHAADAAPLEAGALAALPADRMAMLRFGFAPAVRHLRSDWPVVSIWRANTDPAAPPPRPSGEAAVILRPGFDPLPHLLPAGCGAVLAALMAGATLGEVSNLATESDISALFGLLLAGGALTSATEAR
jgi:hypothetical protein